MAVASKANVPGLTPKGPLLISELFAHDLRIVVNFFRLEGGERYTQGEYYTFPCRIYKIILLRVRGL